MKSANDFRKSTYEIDPEKRQSNKVYKSLSLSEKAMCACLYDICWLGSSQYMVEKNESHLAGELGVTVEELEHFLNKACSTIDGDSLFEESFDLENASFTLIAVELKEQIDTYKTWALKERQITSVKNKMEKKSVSMLELAKDSKSALSSAVSYLDPEHRVLTHYNGWLPTTGFETSGQVFNVRPFVLDELRSVYPTVDISQELADMYDWFSKPRNRRRNVGQMNWFIHNWLERAQNGWAEESKKEMNFADELNKLIDDEMKEAVNE